MKRSTALFLVAAAMVAFNAAAQPTEGLSQPIADVDSAPCRAAAAGVSPQGGWYRQPLSDTVIVFVHGILSDSREAWLTAEPPCQFWPALVAQDPNVGSPAIFLGGYYSKADSGDATIKDVASQLFTNLASPAGNPRLAPIAHKNIIFVAHSLGGIVVRKMLVDYADQFADRKVSLVLFASPAGGSAYADLLTWLEKFYPNSLARQLRSDSASLARINADFISLLETRRRQGMPIDVAQFFESRFPKEECSLANVLEGSLCKIIAANMPAIVPADRAGNFGHLTIVKPHSADDDSHKRLLISLNTFQAIPATPTYAPALGLVSATGTSRIGRWEPEGPTADLVAKIGELCSPAAANGEVPVCDERHSVKSYRSPPEDGDIGFVLLGTDSRSVLGTAQVALTTFPFEPAKDEQGRAVLTDMAANLKGHSLSSDGKLAALFTAHFQPMRYRVVGNPWKLPPQAVPPPSGAETLLSITIPASVEGLELMEEGVAGRMKRRVADLAAGTRLGTLEFREALMQGGDAVYKFAVKPRIGQLAH
jgi:pimeloyl-ACP methyl ester carboxylesterase